MFEFCDNVEMNSNAHGVDTEAFHKYALCLTDQIARRECAAELLVASAICVATIIADSADSASTHEAAHHKGSGHPCCAG